MLTTLHLIKSEHTFFFKSYTTLITLWMLCFSPIPHSYVLIIFMLYEGFEMECIHRCISQTSWWWSRSAFLWAVSPLFIHFTARFFFSFNKFHYRRVSCLTRLFFVYPQLSLWILKLIFTPGYLWSYAKRKAGAYFKQLLCYLIFYLIFMSNKNPFKVWNPFKAYTRYMYNVYKRKTSDKFNFLHSGLICKVSAGNEMAFQTTSFLSALSSREHLLLPLVLGLRHWAKVCLLQRLSYIGFTVHISIFNIRPLPLV